MKSKIFVLSIIGVCFFTISLMLVEKIGNYSPRKTSHFEKGMELPSDHEKRAIRGMKEYFNMLRANPLTGTVSPEEYYAAVEATNKLEQNTKRIVNTVWNERGPDNVGGRTRAFLQDVDSPNVYYVAGVSGGLFKSYTKGTNWSPVNDFQENLNIVSIAMNKNRVICYGTGEGQFVSVSGTDIGTPGFAGAGIFRSTDNGRTFTNIAISRNWGNISSMAAEKGGERIYAGTDGGIKYTDDGVTWSNGRNGACKEIKVATNGHVWAQSGSQIYKSTDRGLTWVLTQPTGAVGTRFAIAISPQDPNYVYTMVANQASALDGVYRTTDGGNTWTKIIQSSSIYFDPLITFGVSNQGNFNNVITVDPLNKNRIIMGGVRLAEWNEGQNPKSILSTNDFGGANRFYVHADNHILEWDMSTTPPTLIFGTDGGLFASQNINQGITMINNGFNATQFYAVAADYDGNIVGGTQDNGTQYINNRGNTKRSAVEIKGGDGFQVDISTKDNSIVFAETYYGNVTRSKDFGKTQVCFFDRRIAKTITDTSKICEDPLPTSWAPFNTKFKLWESQNTKDTNARFFLAKYGQIWMCLNPTRFDKNTEWYVVSTTGSAAATDIEVTPDGNSVFYSIGTKIYRIDGLNSATYDKWSAPTAIPAGITTTDIGLSGATGIIASINLDPSNPDRALITCGQYGHNRYVYIGNNMLSSPNYTNITNNLPSMPVYDGVISYTNPNLLFLATDLGIFASDDNGANWTPQTNPTNKFPKVATLSLKQYYFPNKSNGALYAGTHGRGFFECLQYKTNINSIEAKKPQSSIAAYPNPAIDMVKIDLSGIEGDDIQLSFYDFVGKLNNTIVVGTVKKDNSTVDINVKDIKPGNYIVVVTDGKNNKPKGTIKLVIAR